MLDRDLPAILLPQQSSYDRTFLLSKCVAGNVIRDSEKDERMKSDLEASVRGLCGEEGIDRHLGICPRVCNLL